VDKPHKNRAWLWLFAALFVASIVVAAVMIRYNLSLQLTPEQLEAARALWRAKGLRDYDMVYTKQLNEDPRTEKFAVKVRAGEVVEVLMNGMPLEKENLPYHSMDRLFSYIRQDLDRDHKAGEPKTYLRAIFDDHTGALHSYVRRVMGTRQRSALTVIELTALSRGANEANP
jgi:hypothetical protein